LEQEVAVALTHTDAVRAILHFEHWFMGHIESDTGGVVFAEEATKDGI
jgi:hypothetical protein